MSEQIERLRLVLGRAVEAVGPAGVVHIITLASYGESPSILQGEWDRLIEANGWSCGADPITAKKLLAAAGSSQRRWARGPHLVVELATHGISYREPWYEAHKEVPLGGHSHPLSQDQADRAGDLLDLRDVLDTIAVQTKATDPSGPHYPIRVLLLATLRALEVFREASSGLNPRRAPIPGWAVDALAKISEAVEAAGPLLAETPARPSLTVGRVTRSSRPSGRRQTTTSPRSCPLS